MSLRCFSPGSYLLRTEEWRHGEDQLLLSHIRPYRAVASCTIANWIKEVLSLSGIYTSVFKAHSTRLASTSKVRVAGLSVEDILKRGIWKKSSTWQKFYRKKFDSIGDNAEAFQEKLFTKAL